jgi:mono/diheme cytochrome c family protein
MRLIWLLATGLYLGPASQAQEDGKALFERICTKCHGLAATVRQRNSRERWAAVVDDMISRGAEGTDGEFEKVFDYLVKNFGPRTKVNTASAEELAAGLAIPRSAADAIVEYFKTLEDLKKVSSLDAAEMESKKDRLDFSEAK